MEFVILSVLIVLNGLFAMSEIALVTARRTRLRTLIDEGDTSAAAAVELGENPTRFLSTIQIGITSIGILNGIVGEAALARPLSGELEALGWSPGQAYYAATGIVVVLITYLSIVIGEIVPKRLGQAYPETFARLVARPIEWLAIATKPFVWLLSWSTQAVLRLLRVPETPASSITEEEIHAMLAEGTSAGIIELHEHAMVRNVFRLDDRPIASLMVPRSDVVTLDTELDFETNLARIDESEHARFPVVKDSLDNLLGVLSARRWLSRAVRGEDRSLSALPLKPPLYVPETLTGTELLQHFKSSDSQMAFVLDEYGAIIGIVTLQDLIEAITGEFRPRHPSESWAVRTDDGSWLLDGHIPIPELKDQLGLQSVPQEDRGLYHTLSGMIILLTGRLPRVADSVDWEGWHFEIVDLDGRTIDKVRASRPAPGA